MVVYSFEYLCFQGLGFGHDGIGALQQGCGRCLVFKASGVDAYVQADAGLPFCAICSARGRAFRDASMVRRGTWAA